MSAVLSIQLFSLHAAILAVMHFPVSACCTLVTPLKAVQGSRDGDKKTADMPNGA